MTLTYFFGAIVGVCIALSIFSIRDGDWLLAVAVLIPGVVALDGAIQAYARHL